MSAALLIDFGSTYTKVRALDIGSRSVIGAGQGPSTVQSDVTIGMRAALADLETRVGRLPRFAFRLASSSAAGGLRMVTVGLVRELTAEAARRAALGAGAKLVGTYAYELTGADIEEIRGLAPDIVLLAGGTDGGNSRVVIANARRLGQSDLACPIVYAGNRAAGEEAAALLAGKTVIVASNVMPEFNVLEIESARDAIRRVFIDRIVHAKGIDRAAAEFDAVLMPTPAAVLDGARLVADGVAGRGGLGAVVVVDPGGATTDVHSIGDGAPAAGVVPQGLPEPRVKRTVEGDLGMRHNAQTIVDAAGMTAIAADAKLTEQRSREILRRIVSDVGRLPENPEELALDGALARAAVRLAVTRHCGSIETAYTVTGPVTVQHGKDLSHVDAVIGTGGAIVSSADARSVLGAALADPSDPLSLRPKTPRLLLDSKYLLYACGLLASVEPAAALEIALENLASLDQDTKNERARYA